MTNDLFKIIKTTKNKLPTKSPTINGGQTADKIVNYKALGPNNFTHDPLLDLQIFKILLLFAHNYLATHKQFNHGHQ